MARRRSARVTRRTEGDVDGSSGVIIPGMDDCLHGFEHHECADCLGQVSGSQALSDGTKAGQSFSLVYAPAVREDTFVHLNREGEHWKIRWYPSPNAPAIEMAGSASKGLADLDALDLLHEIDYPTSASTDGETIKNSRYWFDAIARANAQHADRIPALRVHG